MRILIASSEGNCLEGLNADVGGGVSFETFTFVLEALRCGLFLSHASAPSAQAPPCISLLENQNQIIECNGRSVVYTKTK